MLIFYCQLSLVILLSYQFLCGFLPTYSQLTDIPSLIQMLPVWVLYNQRSYLIYVLFKHGLFSFNGTQLPNAPSDH